MQFERSMDAIFGIRFEKLAQRLKSLKFTRSDTYVSAETSCFEKSRAGVHEIRFRTRKSDLHFEFGFLHEQNCSHKPFHRRIFKTENWQNIFLNFATEFYMGCRYISYRIKPISSVTTM